MLYTRKINLIFSDIKNPIFDFQVAARDMINFEWSYIFPRSRINVPLVVSFIFLGDIVETKLIREATLKNHISGSLDSGHLALLSPSCRLYVTSLSLF